MTDLSPAAQTVLDAWSKDENGVYLEGDPERLASALRAAADQMVPLPIGFPTCTWMDGYLIAQKKIRAKILAIADELETL